jgi:hypothetical protein
MSNIYYVYFYLRTDGTPYYCGKGCNGRAYSKNHTVPIPKDKSKIVIAEKNLTEIGSLALERFYIRWYGRKDLGTGILRNMTDGGDGVSGHSDYTIDKIRKNTKIGMNIPEIRAKLSAANKGKKASPETKAKMSKRMKGENNPAKKLESRIKIGLKHKGKIIDVETRKFISEQTKKAMNKPDVRNKMLIAATKRKGIKHSVAHRAKNSEAIKEWWRKRKEKQMST